MRQARRGAHPRAAADPAVRRPINRLDWLERYADKLLAVRDTPSTQRRLFEHPGVPMTLVDDQRRHVDANLPARLILLQRLSSLRHTRIDDLTPPAYRPVLDFVWERLQLTGRVAGEYEVLSPSGTAIRIVYHARTEAQPGLNLITFAPRGWSDHDLGAQPESLTPLTPREIEVLRLVAEGLTGAAIAAALVVSVSTVSTHLRNIYEKLGVADRASAVATAMRLGLIV
jgi:DNA-binding CsgD family transcriptional regulator